MPNKAPYRVPLTTIYSMIRVAISSTFLLHRLIIIPLATFLTLAGFSQGIDSLSIEATFDHKFLNIKADYYYKHKLSPSDSILFTLNPGFKIGGVYTEGIKDFTFVPKKDRPFPFLLVKLDHKVSSHSITKISFDYQIDLEGTNYLKYNWVELMVDQLWFPNAVDFDNKFKSKLTIKQVPPGFSVFSYQPFTRIDDQTYEVIPTEASPEISFLAGKNMKVISKNENDIRGLYFVRSDIPDSILNSIHQKYYQIINFYNHNFGHVKPVNKVSMALRLIPRTLNGSQTSRQFMIITGEDFNSYGNFAHEVSHFWWTGADFIKEPWMNESFANFSAFQLMKRYDTKNYDSYYDLCKKKAELPGPVATAENFKPNTYDLFYFKGAFLLLELENKIGEQQMIKLLEERVSKKINNTSGFLRALEQIAGKKNRLYFEELISK